MIWLLMSPFADVRDLRILNTEGEEWAIHERKHKIDLDHCDITTTLRQEYIKSISSLFFSSLTKSVRR